MKVSLNSIIVPTAVLLAAGFTAQAQFRQNGQFHATKDCLAYTGLAGGYCTIESSDIPEIPKGTTVYYDQALGTPAGYLDSNVLLWIGQNDWAVGRCTLSLPANISTAMGLCTFSDGIGQLAGFTARVKVSYLGGPDQHLWAWDGTYSFNPEPPR